MEEETVANFSKPLETQRAKIFTGVRKSVFLSRKVGRVFIILAIYPLSKW